MYQKPKKVMERKTPPRKNIPTYQIISHVATISYRPDNSRVEVNIVSNSGRNPVYDIRCWRVDEETGESYPAKGISLTYTECIELMKILGEI